MKIKLRLIWIGLFCIAFFNVKAFAEYYPSDAQEARFVLALPSSSYAIYSRSTYVRKTPAVVLDTYSGIVWKCQNMVDESPRWIKTDLGKNKDKIPTTKRYIIRIPDLGSESKISAIVMDTVEGIVWTCPNIGEESSRWIKRSLMDIKEEAAY